MFFLNDFNLKKTFSLGAFLLAFSFLYAQSPKPNIIYIYADDLGYGEIGAYGQSLIKTPNLDKMAQEGMRFTQHYSGAPVCAPSRCMLMTGKHPGHSYIRGNYELGGFKDEEERFRKRYLDILMNKEVRDVFDLRLKFWDATRAFLKKENFFEVETPTLELTTGGAEARPF